MAPVTRPVTRSEARRTNQPLQQLPARITKGKIYHCIVCNEAFASKGWVKRHYRKHQSIPYKANRDPGLEEIMPAYTHQSCWKAEPNSWERIDAVRAKKAELWGQLPPDASSTAREEWRYRFEMVDLAALNLTEFDEKEERKRLSMWQWWWNANGEDYKNHIENGNLGLINIVGDAGFSDLRIQRLQVRRNVVIRRNSSAPTVTERTTNNDPSNSGYQGLKSVTYDSDPPDEDRFAQGPDPGAYDLIQNYLENGELTMPGVMHFLSDANIRYTQAEGETFDSGTTLAHAARDFVDQVAATDDIKDACQQFEYDRTGSDEQGDAARREDAAQYRIDREAFYDFLEQATQSWFAAEGHSDERLLKCLRGYAGELKDSEGLKEIRTCFEKNRGVLDEIMLEKEQWRVSPRWQIRVENLREQEAEEETEDDD